MSFAIADYAALKQQVQAWSFRRDPTFVGMIPTFIALGEATMKRALNMHSWEQSFTKIVPAGSDRIIPDSPDLFNPAFKRVIGVWTRASESSEPELVPQEIEVDTAYSGAGLRPRFWSMENGSHIKFSNVMGADTIVDVRYEWFPSLSDNITTNWILQQYPDAYLAAAMVNAYQFSHDAEKMNEWGAKMGAAISDATAAERRKIRVTYQKNEVADLVNCRFF